MERRDGAWMSASALILLCALAAGCRSTGVGPLIAGGPGKISLAGDDDAVRQSILAALPVGASLEEAQAELAKAGFTFAEGTEIGESGLERSFLFCELPPGTRTAPPWEVNVYYDSSGVTEVTVERGRQPASP